MGMTDFIHRIIVKLNKMYCLTLSIERNIQQVLTKGLQLLLHILLISNYLPVSSVFLLRSLSLITQLC